MRFVCRGVLALLVVASCKDDDGGDSSSDDTGAEASTGEAPAGTAGEESSGTAGQETADSDESGDTSDNGPWDSFEERPCPEDSFVTYENFGWPHMLTFCTGCHSSMLPADMRQGAPIEVNFESVQDVRQQAGRIWARSGDQHLSMPPVGPAADQERVLLGEWLACGAPTDADLGTQ